MPGERRHSKGEIAPEIVAAIIAVQIALERQNSDGGDELSRWKMRGRPDRPWARNSAAGWKNRHSRIRTPVVR